MGDREQGIGEGWCGTAWYKAGHRPLKYSPLVERAPLDVAEAHVALGARVFGNDKGGQAVTKKTRALLHLPLRAVQVGVVASPGRPPPQGATPTG